MRLYLGVFEISMRNKYLMKTYIRFRKIFLVTTVLLPLSCSAGQQGNDLQNVMSTQAELTAKISGLQSELSVLSGRVEELEYRLRGQTQQIEKRLDLVSSRVPPPDGVPEYLLNADEEALKSNMGQSAVLYKTGLSQIRTGDFEAARNTFTTFVENNPNTAYTDNALFWIGMTWEMEGDYNKAIVAYSDAYQRFPAEDYAPIAIYQIAESFNKLGDKKNANLMLQKLVDDYPKSRSAKQAKDKLGAVKKK